jgi:hypothetical protein
MCKREAAVHLVGCAAETLSWVVIAARKLLQVMRFTSLRPATRPIGHERDPNRLQERIVLEVAYSCLI